MIFDDVVVLDHRPASRPVCFDGTEEGMYDEWRSQPAAYLTAVDPGFADVADEMR